jgi:hypothetical protein
MMCSQSIQTPPRYRWLIRLSLLYVMLAMATVALRYHWLRVSRGEVEAQIASYRREGQPVLWRDFAPAPLADEQNAAVALRAAANAATLSKAEQDFMNAGVLGVPTTGLAGQRLGQLVDAHRAALNHVRRARGLARIEWPLDFNQAAESMLLPDLGPQRGLVYFLQSAVQVAHARGREAEAIEHCRDTLFCARAIDRQPAVISMLVGSGIDELAAQTLWQILPTLRLDDPAARQAAVGLIGDLLDDQAVRDGSVRAVYAERAMRIDTVGRLAAGDPAMFGSQQRVVERFLGWWYRPVMEGELRSTMTEMTRQARSAAAPDAPAAAQALGTATKRANRRRRGTDALLHPLSRSLDVSLIAAMQRGYQSQRDRRAAAVDLAARLYELDRGRPPARVEDLAPVYLPRGPIDPMTGTAMTRTFGTPPATTQALPK